MTLTMYSNYNGSLLTNMYANIGYQGGYSYLEGAFFSLNLFGQNMYTWASNVINTPNSKI
jgi:hypothetical protein